MGFNAHDYITGGSQETRKESEAAPADPFHILGIARGSSLEDAKKARAKIARENHPDIKPGDEKAARKLQEANLAVDTIADPQRLRNFYAGEVALDGSPIIRQRPTYAQKPEDDAKGVLDAWFKKNGSR